jgi:hypothetical protein
MCLRVFFKYRRARQAQSSGAKLQGAAISQIAVCFVGGL